MQDESEDSCSFQDFRRRRRGPAPTKARHQHWNVHDLKKSSKGMPRQFNSTTQLTRKERRQRVEPSQPLTTVLAHPPGMGTVMLNNTLLKPVRSKTTPKTFTTVGTTTGLAVVALSFSIPQGRASPTHFATVGATPSAAVAAVLCTLSGGRASATHFATAPISAVLVVPLADPASPEDTANTDSVEALHFAIPGGRASPTDLATFGGTALALYFRCGGGYSVEVPSCRGPSQWIIGYVDNRSGFGEEDDNNSEEVEKRDGEEVLSVACSKG